MLEIIIDLTSGNSVKIKWNSRDEVLRIMPDTQLAFRRGFHWVRRGNCCRRGSQLQSLRITKGNFSRYRSQRSLHKKWGIIICSATPSDFDAVGPRKPWRNSALMMAIGRGGISLAQLKTQEQFIRHTPRRAGDSSLPAQSFPFHTLSYICPVLWAPTKTQSNRHLMRSSHYYWISLVAQTVKRLPTMLETWVRSLGLEDPLEKEMSTHSSTLAWRIPWREKPGGIQSMGSQRVGHD